MAGGGEEKNKRKESSQRKLEQSVTVPWLARMHEAE